MSGEKLLQLFILAVIPALVSGCGDISDKIGRLDDISDSVAG